VIDDFAPAGTQSYVQRLHRDADRILRAQGNRSGRQRMSADASLKSPRPPRGLILSTGDDIPRGQFLKAGTLVIELREDGPGSLDWDHLTSCQRDAGAGLNAQAMAGFLQWLACRYYSLDLRAELVELRDVAYQNSQHRRTPGIVADVAMGLR